MEYSKLSNISNNYIATCNHKFEIEKDYAIVLMSSSNNNISRCNCGKTYCNCSEDCKEGDVKLKKVFYGKNSNPYCYK